MQGTILDRIDYNLETTVHYMDEAHKQLEQTNVYQKKVSLLISRF